jgi:nitroreductase
MQSNAFKEIVQFRRSNRVFDENTLVPDEVIATALEHAQLSPNSSNMQLWEFYWIASPEKLAEIAPLCLNQSAAKTAKHLVVFVTRRDFYKKRAKWNLENVQKTVTGEPNKMQKNQLMYYSKLVPMVYANDPFGLMTFVRRTISFFGGLTKPFFRLGGKASIRIVTHKSCALAAQTFMLGIAAEGFHSCPLEGFDELRLKHALKLPRKAEINMVVAVGKGTEKGIWGERIRVPSEEVVIKL